MRNLGSCTIKYIAKIFSLYVYMMSNIASSLSSMYNFLRSSCTPPIWRRMSFWFYKSPYCKEFQTSIKWSLWNLLHNIFVWNSNYSSHRIAEIDFSIGNAIKILDAILFDSVYNFCSILCEIQTQKLFQIENVLVLGHQFFPTL